MSFDAIANNPSLLKAFIDQIDCPLLYLSQNGTLKLANHLSIKILQLDPNDYIGINFVDFCKNHQYLLVNIIQKNKTSIQSIEETYSTEDMEYTVQWKIIPFSHFDSSLTDYFLLGHDITPYKLATEKLKNTTFFYENILSKLPTNVYWKDKNSVYLGCNERLANVMGLSSREAIKGMTDYDFPWGKAAAESFIAFDQKVMQGDAALTTEDIFKEASGKIVTVLTSKTPLKNEIGETIGVLAISVDITELKQTQAQLKIQKEKSEMASRAKSEFIANMSHDIRTPIAGMLGVVQDLLNNVDQTKSSLPEQSKKPTNISATLGDFVETVQQDGELLMTATDELLQLCNEILEVVRLESGKYEETPESFNLPELINHNIELLQPVAQHRKLKLSADIDSLVPEYLKGLRNYLDRVLLNLISNALKFTEQGFVSVNVQLADHQNKDLKKDDKIILQIHVKDSGIGIPSDKFDTIFEHFSRLTPAYEGLYKGAGLGLYTVKRYMDAMNGEIHIKSEVGKGTCFTITLSFTVSDHTERPKKSVRLPRSLKSTNMKKIIAEKTAKTSASKNATISVLLVEDSHLAAMAATLTLKTFDCSVDVAENASQAIEKAQKNSYDLILMDIGLPDFSGIEATKKIHAIKPQIPIVALTGHANNGEKQQECLDAGMQDVLSKPIQPLALEAILQRLIFKTPSEKKIPLSDENTVTSDSSKENNIIDWDACVHMCNGDKKMATELLLLLAADLQKSEKILIKSYNQNNTKTLCAELHRLRGGVCYLKLPQLETVLKIFHEAIKAEPKNSKKLEKAFLTVQQAISSFQKKWKDEIS